MEVYNSNPVRKQIIALDRVMYAWQASSYCATASTNLAISWVFSAHTALEQLQIQTNKRVTKQTENRCTSQPKLNFNKTLAERTAFIH